MSNSEMLFSVHVNLRNLVLALPMPQRQELAQVLIAAIKSGEHEPSAQVLMARAPGQNGQVLGNGFVHHEKDTKVARVSDGGRLRINVRPARNKAQLAVQGLETALQSTASQVEAEFSDVAEALSGAATAATQSKPDSSVPNMGKAGRVYAGTENWR